MFQRCFVEAQRKDRNYNNFNSPDPFPVVGTFLGDLEQRGFEDWPEKLEKMRRAMIMFLLVMGQDTIIFDTWETSMDFAEKLLQREAHLDYNDQVHDNWGLVVLVRGGDILADNYQAIDCLFGLVRKSHNKQRMEPTGFEENDNMGDNLCK